MHLLFISDNLRLFDPGTDLLYCDHAFLQWRDAEQMTPNGFLCAIVDGNKGRWTITPFGNRRFVDRVDKLPGINAWLDEQSSNRYNPGHLHVHHHSGFRRILHPVSTHAGLANRRVLMNGFFMGRFGVSWWFDYDEPRGEAGINKTWRDIHKAFVAELLRRLA